MRSSTKILIATGAVALLHSALASRPAKSAAARLIGEHRRNVYYRPFYIAQSILTFGPLVLYIRRLPDHVLWEMNKGYTIASYGIRAATLWGFYKAARQIGIGRLTGLNGLLAHRNGVRTIPPEPEAQGPALDPGRKATGPFRYTRHPLNFLAIPLIWLAPRMTRNRFVFNSAATTYFVLGSIHEEHRLKEAYGEAYNRYQDEAQFLIGRKNTKKRDLSVPREPFVRFKGHQQFKAPVIDS